MSSPLSCGAPADFYTSSGLLGDELALDGV